MTNELIAVIVACSVVAFGIVLGIICSAIESNKIKKNAKKEKVEMKENKELKSLQALASFVHGLIPIYCNGSSCLGFHKELDEYMKKLEKKIEEERNQNKNCTPYGKVKALVEEWIEIGNKKPVDWLEMAAIVKEIELTGYEVQKSDLNGYPYLTVLDKDTKEIIFEAVTGKFSD